MGVRIASGAALILFSLVFLLVGGWPLALVLCILSCIAYRELLRAIGVSAKGGNVLEAAGYPVMAGYYGVLVYGALCQAEVSFWISVILFGAFGLFMSVYVFTFPKYRSEQVMSAFFCVIYAAGMMSCIYLTRNLTYGKLLVWLVFISSSICDTCAYFVGVKLGKHKLAPVLSPKKTVEGAVGGVLGSGIAGVLYGVFCVEPAIQRDGAVWVTAVICMAGAVISQIGDLAASAIKRNHDIKDYGTCIPGHGGIMDRFDSVMFTAPIIYFLAVFFLGV